MTDTDAARSSASGHGRLRLHGRRALAGVAHRGPVLRPAAAPVDMAALGGRNADAAGAAADRLGWADVETDWRRLIARDDIDLVDICTPGDTPRRDRDRRARGGQARAVREAAGQHRRGGRGDDRGRRGGRGPRRPVDGRASTTGGCPPLALARRLVAAGRLGTIRHVRAQYLQDWIVDPQFPLVWRLQKERAGSGALGDIGAHIVDAAQFVTGRAITGVSAVDRDVRQGAPAAVGDVRRPGGHRRVADEGTGEVTVDDAAIFTARLTGGMLGVFEATRFATGRKNAMRLEVNGSRGQPRVRLRGDERAARPRRGARTPTSPGSPGSRSPSPTTPTSAAWWPPGHLHRLRAHVHPRGRRPAADIAAGADPAPSFADGLQVQRVLAAVEASAAAESRWTPSPDTPPSRPRTAAARHSRGADRCRDRSPCSPASGPTCRSRRCAGWPSEWGYDGLEVACWGDHLDVVRGRRGRRVRRGAAATCSRSTA